MRLSLRVLRQKKTAEAQRHAVFGRAHAAGLNDGHGLAQAQIHVQHQKLVEGQAGFTQRGEQGQRQAQQMRRPQGNDVIFARLGLHGRAFPEPVAIGHADEG